MAVEYSVDLCNELKQTFKSQALYRPMRPDRYDLGTVLTYDMQFVDSGKIVQVTLQIEKFVGGGYAGQVYRVKVTGIDAPEGAAGTLQIGSTYALKILIPPSNFSRLFRNTLYWIGFQGPFQLQTNPAAARSGAIWQKFIRRAAKVRFGSELVVNDVHATFVDNKLGSCGELSDWIEGRTWRLEVDDNLDTLKQWKKGKQFEETTLDSAEYRAKYRFMHNFVDLLHDIGAHEFARQYEWSTCKSQPNCLKRTESEDDPETGLVAVDFRAGLALLPILPMSPGDFKLIGKGLARGSLVQFDRGNIDELEKFINSCPADFQDLMPMLEELKKCEEIYRDSVPDITHNFKRLFTDGKLWNRIFDSAVTGWKVRDLIDERTEGSLRNNKPNTFLFFSLALLSGIGLLSTIAGFIFALMRLVYLLLGSMKIVEDVDSLPLYDQSGYWWPMLIGGIIVNSGFRIIRKAWGRQNWRRHYWQLLRRGDYFKRALKAKMAEKTILWHRAGRVTEEKARKISQCVICFICHSIVSFLPAPLHRFFTDPACAKEKLYNIFVRPFKLYFNKDLREQWLLDMLEDGKKNHIVSHEDAEIITSQINEPYIQRYLVSLVVHIMTAPVTQLVFAIIGYYYLKAHPELSSAEKSMAFGVIMFIGQVIPISPGSICRGLYTTGLAIYDRNFKDYNIALFLSYCKYIGYLAFPIQMNYRYPAIARFMAAHWATSAIHIIPVFGERGALLEHWAFCFFYNWPLTVKRRMIKISQIRSSLKTRLWHIPICALIPAVFFGLAERYHVQRYGEIPSLRDIWLFAIVLPYMAGALTTRYAGGMVRLKRAISATAAGALMGIFYAIITIFTAQSQNIELTVGQLVSYFAWRMFPFAVISTIGALIAEFRQRDPDLKQ